MPGIVAIVNFISDDVVAALAAANYPALIDGKILLGRQYQFETSAPPRIIFIPTDSNFETKDLSSAANVTNGGYTAEQLLQLRNRSILSDDITFEVRCWGVSPDQNPDNDFDYTQALYQQVIRSIHLLTVGRFTCSRGKWTDATLQNSQMIRDGREFVFSVTFGTPITALITPLPLAPDNVAPENTTILKLPTGETEIGCDDEDD